MLKNMTDKPFAPKDAETLKSEIIADLGIDYEGNEEIVDKAVARELKNEEFKASLHADKKKHLEGKQTYVERLKKAGIDPETGEKLEVSKETTTPTKTNKSYKEQILENRALNDVHEDDVEEIAEYAERKGLSLYEAKKSPVIQAFLSTRSEERKTAAAANTGSSRKSNTKADGEAILKKADSYQLDPSEMKDAAKVMIASVFGGK